MAKQTIQEKIKAHKAAWKKAKPKQGYEDLPNGDYEGVIKNAIMSVAKETGNLMVVYTLNVTEEGDFKDRTQMKRDMLETDENKGYAKGALKNIDVDAPDDLEEFGDCLEQEVIGLPILFSVSHSKEFVNVYFRERLEGAEKVEPDADSDEGDGNNDVLTSDDVRDYLDDADGGRKMFRQIIKENNLDIKLRDYKTLSEVSDLIIDQLELD